MKKLIIFLAVAVLMGCNCLSQVPPQYLPANISCEAYLPNYLEYVSVINNCGTATLVQEPLPGTILDIVNSYVEVTITATNSFGNTDVEKFDVYLWDAPEIIWDSIPGDTVPPIAFNPNELDMIWGSYVVYRAHLGDTIRQDSTWKPLKYWYLY